MSAVVALVEVISVCFVPAVFYGIHHYSLFAANQIGIAIQTPKFLKKSAFQQFLSNRFDEEQS